MCGVRVPAGRNSNIAKVVYRVIIVYIMLTCAPSTCDLRHRRMESTFGQRRMCVRKHHSGAPDHGVAQMGGETQTLRSARPHPNRAEAIARITDSAVHRGKCLDENEDERHQQRTEHALDLIQTQ